MEVKTKFRLEENYEQIALLEAVVSMCGNRKLKRAVKNFVKSMKKLQKVVDKMNRI